MRPRIPVLGLLTAGLLALPPSPVTAAEDPVGGWPVTPPPAVVHRFDAPVTTWGAGHRGVDLAASPGQTVRSALPGRVAFVGRIAGRGVVVVSHGSTRTTYEPVAGTVVVGQWVAAGDPVGHLEAVGSHCFPATCLHWGWISGSTYLDPLRLVGAGPVRLLPLWGERPAPQARVRLAGALAGRPVATGR